MDLKELQEKRGQLAEKIRELAKNQAKWTAEDRQQWDAVNDDLNTVEQQITETRERLDVEARVKSLDRDDNSLDPPPPRREQVDEAAQRNLALQGWMRAARLQPTDEQREACRATGINLASQEIDLPLYRDYAEVRAAQSAATGSGGGFTIAPDFITQLEVAMLAFGGVRSVATVMRTDTAADLPYPTLNDTTNSGAMIAEKAQVSSTALTFSQVTLKAYKFYSMIQVPFELMQDSAFNMAGVCSTALGERLARATATYYTTGTGAAQPYGIVNSSTVGVTTASATAIASTELVDMVHSVDPAYRQTGCGWMMNDAVVKYIRKLQLGDGQFLWIPGLQASEPSSILGYPITVNQQMSSTITASDITALFGQLSKYMIRDVAGIRLKRLDERYADYDQVAFLAFLRTDGNLLDAGGHPVKNLTQHA